MYLLITIDREADTQFVKQKKKSEPLNKDLKYVSFPVTTAQITDTVEAAIPQHARPVAREIIDEANSQKPDADCRSLRCELHGLNSSNIAQIQHIDCAPCRAC